MVVELAEGLVVVAKIAGLEVAAAVCSVNGASCE